MRVERKPTTWSRGTFTNSARNPPPVLSQMSRGKPCRDPLPDHPEKVNPRCRSRRGCETTASVKRTSRKLMLMVHLHLLARAIHAGIKRRRADNGKQALWICLPSCSNRCGGTSRSGILVRRRFSLWDHSGRPGQTAGCRSAAESFGKSMEPAESGPAILDLVRVKRTWAAAMPARHRTGCSNLDSVPACWCIEH